MYSAAFLRLTALPLKAAAVLCVLPVDSEGQQLPLRGEIVDVFRDDIPIGGARLVGVSVTTEDRRVDLQNLRAFLPSSTSQSLCVEVRSRDGRYLASAEFDASGVTPGAYQLPWNTRYSAKLKDYPEEDLSVLARLMDTCDGMDANPTIVVASWGAADLEPVVHFFFNVAVEDEIIFGIQDGSTFGTCTEFSEGRSVAYNVRCTITLGRDATHVVRLVTWHFEVRSTRDFTVRIP